MTNTIGHGVTQISRKPVDVSTETWDLLNKQIKLLQDPDSDLSEAFEDFELARLNTQAAKQSELRELLELRQHLIDRPNM